MVIFGETKDKNYRIMFSIKVTNEEKYNRVNDVELNLKSCNGMQGDVSFEVEGEEGERVYSGQHGSHDYEEEFGFVIVQE